MAATTRRTPSIAPATTRTTSSSTSRFAATSWAGTQGPLFEPADFNRFGARFASLLWDGRLHTWAEAEKNVSVKSAREVWWQPFAAVRPAAGGGTLFVVHLINPPEGKTVLAKENVPSEPAKDVAVTFKEPKGFRRAVLVNFPSCDVRPMEPKREGGQLVFAVEQVPYWAMLVVEADCPTPAARYEKAAEIKSAAPSAEDLQLMPKAEAVGGKPDLARRAGAGELGRRGDHGRTGEGSRRPRRRGRSRQTGPPARWHGQHVQLPAHPRQVPRDVPPEGGRQHDGQAGLPYRRRRLRHAPAARRAGDLEPDAGDQGDGLQEAQRLPGLHRPIRARRHGLRRRRLQLPGQRGGIVGSGRGGACRAVEPAASGGALQGHGPAGRA